MVHPVEVATVYNATAHCSSVAVHVFCGAVGHNVSSPLKRSAIDWCGKGVVNDEWHPVFVGNLGIAFNVEYVATRVGYCFAKDALGVGPEQGFDFFVGCIFVNKGAFNAHFLERDAKQVVGAAVNGVG